MKIRDIVTEPVIACSPEHEFRQRAAEITWSEDCGALPGIEDGKPAGILRWTKRSPQGADRHERHDPGGPQRWVGLTLRRS